MSNNYIGITENRLKHGLAVARLMYKTAKENGKTEEYAKEMFMLGYLHDIGYEFTDTTHKESHPGVGAELVSTLNMNYKYTLAILLHGQPYRLIGEKYRTEELDLLNWADLNIDHTGEHVGMYTRLLGIKKRYGKDSTQYENACEIVSYLRKKYKKE